MVKNKKYKRLPIKLSEENLWSVCAYLHCNILAPTRISNEAESRASLVTARAVLVNKTVWVGTRLRVLFYFVHQASHSQADSAHLWPRSYWLPWLGAQSYVLQKVFPFCWISNFFSFTQVSIFFNYSLDSCSISSYCTVCAVILSWSSNENFYRLKICFSIFARLDEQLCASCTFDDDWICLSDLTVFAWGLTDLAGVATFLKFERWIAI